MTKMTLDLDRELFYMADLHSRREPINEIAFEVLVKRVVAAYRVAAAGNKVGIKETTP